MKNKFKVLSFLISSLLSFIILYGCGSAKSEIFYKDPVFNSADFFNSSITIFPPMSVSISKDNFSNYSEEKAKNDLINKLKAKIEDSSTNANVFIDDQKVPDYLRGIIFKKNEAKKFFKDVKTKYLVIIQQVFVGEDTKNVSLTDPMTGRSTGYVKGVTKLIMTIDIWKTDTESSMFSIEIKSDVNHGVLESSLNLSFDTAINEFISSIKKN